MTQNVISAINGTTGDVIENAEVMFSVEDQDVLPAPSWIGGEDWGVRIRIRRDRR